MINLVVIEGWLEVHVYVANVLSYNIGKISVRQVSNPQ